MRVSVVIPVYDAEPYVAQAVDSALEQPQTEEVLLVEDGSTDRSLEICQELEADEPRVRLLRHPDGRNQGAGATRNLGVNHARCEFLAFLDADDYYLPGRFENAETIFLRDPQADGVYEAVGTHFEDDEARERWYAQHVSELTTIWEEVPPTALFEAQAPVGSSGWPHLDGFVLRSSALRKLDSGSPARAAVGTSVRPFDESLRLHQDTALFIMLSGVCRLLPGRLRQPVAMRRVHSSNRILAPRSPGEIYRTRYLMWLALWRWSRRRLPLSRRRLVVRRMLGWSGKCHDPALTGSAGVMAISRQVGRLLLSHPTLLVDRAFWAALLR